MAGALLVSVVVPVRDGARTLGRCLDALAAQRLDRDRFEVLVVDNGSGDGTGRLAAEHPLGPTVLAEPRPGSYAARNAGLAAARADVLAFTDADCVPEPGWLQAGLAAFAPGVDLVAGRVVALRSERPSVWERYDRAMYLDQRVLVENERTAATANLLVHRRVFDAVGPFDASLRSGGDVHLCARAARAGFRIVYAPDAVVGHVPRTRAGETWRLHRRLGAGWAALAARGERPAAWRDPALRTRLGTVIDRIAADGPPLRRRHVLHVHAVVTAARLTGRLTRRG